MDKNIGISNIESVKGQRNLLLGFTILSLSCLLLVSLKLITTEEKTILVPGLTQEVWTKEGGVSASYLEETTLMYLPLLLDLNPEIIDHKGAVIFKYVSRSDQEYMKKLQNYFAENKEKYKQFGLSTYFAVKNIEVDTKKLLVKANGILTSRYGEKGFETTPQSYLISYEWTGGKLRLKEFVQVEGKDKEGSGKEENKQENNQ